MKTCIIICRKRQELFNFNKVFVSKKYRFIFVSSRENILTLDKTFKSNFSEIVSINNVCDEELIPIIQKEIQHVGNENLRLLCLDELDVLTIANLRSKFNIPGTRANQYILFRNKVLMKTRLNEANIRIPKFVALGKLTETTSNELYKTIINTINLPFIVKPTLGASAVGTKKIENVEAFFDWFEIAKNEDIDFEAEEFINGQLYYCDSFVKNGEILFSEVSQCLTSCLDYANGKNEGGLILPEEDSLRNKIIDFNKKIINQLKAPNGALHLELFVDVNNELVFVEIAARPGGAEVVKIHELNFGISLYEQSLRSELDEQLTFNIKKNLYHAWAYLAVPNGQIKAILNPKLQSQAEIYWNIKVGDQISGQPSSVLRKKAALIIFKNKDFSKIQQDYKYLRTFKAVEI